MILNTKKLTNKKFYMNWKTESNIGAINIRAPKQMSGKSTLITYERKQGPSRKNIVMRASS